MLYPKLKKWGTCDLGFVFKYQIIGWNAMDDYYNFKD